MPERSQRDKAPPRRCGRKPTTPPGRYAVSAALVLALRSALAPRSDRALSRMLGATPQRVSRLLGGHGRLGVGELVAWLARVAGVAGVAGVRVVIDGQGARVEVLQGEWSPRGGPRRLRVDQP